MDEGFVESRSECTEPPRDAEQHYHVSVLDDPGSMERVDDFVSCMAEFRRRHGSIFERLDTHSGPAASVPTLHNCQGEEQYRYSELGALELHMRVAPDVRIRRLFELVKLGDVMEGHVTSKERRELTVRVTGFVGSHKFRELADINVQGVVTYDNLSDEPKESDKIWDEMRLKDVVQGVVVSARERCINLSFRDCDIQEFCEGGQLPPGVQLGYQSGKTPSYAKQWTGRSNCFLNQLEDDPGFSNPSCVDNLKSVLGIGPGSSEVQPMCSGMRPTLFKDIQMAEYDPGDYHDRLRKAQRAKWSLQSVAAGVATFKKGESSKAMKMLDHALDIDPLNVEGLVARGALYANDGHYKDAIKDFEKALTINHTHRNARKYLVETQVALGKESEKTGKIEEAMRCYREALADDPDQTLARERLQLLTAFTQKQAEERRERELKKLNDEKTLKKIQKLLDKDKAKRSSKKKSKKKKTVKVRKSKASRVKHKTKLSRKSRSSQRHSSSSESESRYSDSDSSTESASSPDRHYHSDKSRKRRSYKSSSDTSPPYKQRKTSSRKHGSHSKYSPSARRSPSCSSDWSPRVKTSRGSCDRSRWRDSGERDIYRSKH